MYNFHWMHRNLWENNKKGLLDMIVFMESHNIKSVLLPYGPTGADFSLHIPEMLLATKRIKILLALPAYGVLPEYAMKTFITAQRWSRDRLDLNLVAGNYRGEIEQSVLSNYPWDTDVIDTHEKRVNITEKWMEVFTNLYQQYIKDYNDAVPFKMTTYVVGASDTTIRTANKYTDYIIINDLMLNEETLSKITNAKLMMVIDPLILENPNNVSNVEYSEYTYTKNKKHPMSGTYDEVVNQIKEIAEKFNINDFIIHTDQKDISQIMRLVDELSLPFDKPNA